MVRRIYRSEAARRIYRSEARQGKARHRRRHHLVLAVEVGEADLGGVLERAVGLAPRPGTHAAGRPSAAASPRDHRSPTGKPAS